MEFIMEHFGIGFLYLLAGSAMSAVLAVFLKQGGVIYEQVILFFRGICGA